MSWSEFLYWIEYEKLEPWGEERADLRSATIACILANQNRDPKKTRKPYTVDMFTAESYYPLSATRAHEKERVKQQAADEERLAVERWNEEKERMKVIAIRKGLKPRVEEHES